MINNKTSVMLTLHSLRARVFAATLICLALTAQAVQFTQPKREFRSSWVATVWCLDWPQEGSRGTGPTNTALMKQQLITLLDSLEANNFNAVNFQVRSMCDAMYQSSYEPWSSYLTGVRGATPGFDPLAMCVEECHKRGMECHAWVNPYRFSTGSDWNTPQDQVLKNDGWLLTYGSTIILDPAQQRVIDRIVDVCREIITKYDVDGILYDDYFYPNGIPSDATAGDYQEWLDSNVDMTIGDWRRNNVNRMVKAVYNMIQETRPEVRFGISPAGVTCTSQAVADSHGVERSSGSDWQYNGIFSDPLAWYEDKSVDYISPQIYWHIGYSAADYGKLTPWWSKVAQKFGRHMYVSHSISELKRDSYGSLNPEPSMTSSTPYDEFANQVELNRTSNLDGAFGSIFYSTKYIYNLGAAESFGHYLKRVVYQRPALPPAMTWKTATDPGQVKSLQLEGNRLVWEGYDNVRYTVYAFPQTLAHEQFNRDGEYLLGFCYDTAFELPDQLLSGYQYAVCVLDRMGNEYEPAILGEMLDPLPAPTLIAPATGSEPFSPFDFVWSNVDGAQQYTLEVAQDASFDLILERATTSDTCFSSAALTCLTSGETHYWRVLASGEGFSNGVSERRAVKPTLLVLTNPYDGQKDLPVAFTAAWNTPDGTTPGTLTVATDEAMTEKVLTATATGGAYAIPQGTLRPGNKYYAQVALAYNGHNLLSPVVTFTTAFDVPTFLVPTDGGILYSNDRVTVERQSEATSYVIEISNSATTWGRTRYVETIKDGMNQSAKTADEIKVNGALMTDGATYYARAKVSYLNEQNTNTSTDFCPIISFVYSSQTRPDAITGDLDRNGVVDVSDLNLIINIILGLTPQGDMPADLDGNGIVDISDLNLIINIILGVS